MDQLQFRRPNQWLNIQWEKDSSLWGYIGVLPSFIILKGKQNRLMFSAQFVPNIDFSHFSLKIKLIIIQITSISPRRISLSKKKKKNTVSEHSFIAQWTWIMNRNEEKLHIWIFLRCAFDAEPLLYFSIKLDALIKQTENHSAGNFKGIFSCWTFWI